MDMEYGMDMEPETDMVSSLGIRKINTTIYIYIYGKPTIAKKWSKWLNPNYPHSNFWRFKAAI